MSQTVTEQGLTLTLKNFNKLTTRIQANLIPTGPLVNISSAESNSEAPYVVTVLAYIPNNKLKPIDTFKGLSLQDDLIYLNYYGEVEMSVLNKEGEPISVSCRDFRVEFNCKEETGKYDLYYLQFEYILGDVTPVDAICVRDDNEDPETDRGTVTSPATTG